MNHPYLPLTDQDREEMLQALGLRSVSELFEELLPPEVRLNRPLQLPPRLSEWEVQKKVEALAGQNQIDWILFMGAGAYDHYIPAVIQHIASRSEFYTAYTPYQAEVSQGTLQVMYEFQSLVCDLTEMEVANSSMYDGASALAEAVLMALRIQKKRNVVLLPESLHPFYRQVVETYVHRQDLQLQTLRMDPKTGQLDLNHVESLLGDHTAALVFQHPNFFGILEDPRILRQLTEKVGALLIQVFDPISLGILEPPGALGVDIAVAEGQPLGIPLGFGGPYLGLLATRQAYVRQMPGRLAGMTRDLEGRRGFVMALQTREQHIRREKATSNICTNQMLCALMATAYLSLMGKEGIREVAYQSLAKAHYFSERLSQIPAVRLQFTGPFFREFVISLSHPEPDQVYSRLQERKILFGVPLARFQGPAHDFLIAVTEKRTREEMDTVVEALQELVG